MREPSDRLLKALCRIALAEGVTLRVQRIFLVTDATGSVVKLYQYRSSRVFRLFGLVPVRVPSTCFRLDTGEDVIRDGRSGHFRIRSSGEALIRAD